MYVFKINLIFFIKKLKKEFDSKLDKSQGKDDKCWQQALNYRGRQIIESREKKKEAGSEGKTKSKLEITKKLI